MEYILVAVVSVAIMVGFAFFVIKNISKRINQNTKKYFLDKLQEYDYMIDEKKREIQKLTKELETLKDEKEMKQEMEEYQKHKEKMSQMVFKKPNQELKEIIYDIPTPKYRQEQFFDSYKKLKKQFHMDNQKILEKFIQEHRNGKEDKIYQNLEKIKNYFDQSTIYQCVTLTSKEQYEIVAKTLSEKEKEMLNWESYKETTFSILLLLENLETQMKQNDPTIYVYVGNQEENYDFLGEQVKTEFYKNMSEGIIIKYHNQMYDYSI